MTKLLRYADVFEAHERRKVIYSFAKTIQTYSSFKEQNGMLVGYKGKSSFDTGAFYVPYTPLQTYGITRSPERRTFYVEKSTVTTPPRVLTAEWSLNPIKDGFDIADELQSSLVDEITRQIDEQVLREIRYMHTEKVLRGIKLKSRYDLTQNNLCPEIVTPTATYIDDNTTPVQDTFDSEFFKLRKR